MDGEAAKDMEGEQWKGKAEDVLKTMISRIKTMKPRSPPPVPYFHALPWLWAVVSVSSAMAKDTRSRLRRIDWNISAVCLRCYLYCLAVLNCIVCG